MAKRAERSPLVPRRHVTVCQAAPPREHRLSPLARSVDRAGGPGHLRLRGFVVRPPRERPIVCVCAPFFHRRPSDAPLPSLSRSFACHEDCPDKGIEELLPEPPSGTPVKAVVNGGRRTIDSRQPYERQPTRSTWTMPLITPRSSTRGAPGVLWQQRLNRSPLEIAQPEFASHDPNSNPFRSSAIL
ncbi:hypothetical protein QO004_006194 [Rhizobium mesoamericanum]|nr:hypothetical protein [Rhizobium mesoamericanum]